MLFVGASYEAQHATLTHYSSRDHHHNSTHTNYELWGVGVGVGLRVRVRGWVGGRGVFHSLARTGEKLYRVLQRVGKIEEKEDH